MSDIEIITHKRTSGFTIVPNHIINADYLKLEERAFLIWALSKPETWQLNYKSIKAIHGISNNKISTISKRLQETHHLFIKREKCGKTTWMVFEEQEDCCAHIECTRQTTTECTPTDPVLNPHSQFEIDPHSQKPNSPQESALERTDLLERTDQDISSSDDAQILSDADILFPKLWKAWPNKKNKKRAQSDFKRLIKNMPSTTSFNLVDSLVGDIEARIRVNQLGFNAMMLSTYLNGERWLDDITQPEPTTAQNKDAAKEEARRRANEKAKREMGL